MSQFDAKVLSQNAASQSVGFLLLDNFTLISLASAVEPLRMGNQLSGRELYRWYTISVDGAAVQASDGLKITPDCSIAQVPPMDMLIVCGGIDIQNSVRREHLSWLRAQARRGCRLGAVCTGSWVLAHAGLLNGYECSVHWELLAALQEAFPRVNASTRLFSIDRDRFTCSGGTAPMDIMLHMIGRDHGRELSAAISEMFIYERIRNEQDHQRVPLKHVLGSNQPKLQEIVALMESNLEEPIDLDELSVYVNVSRRQLERLFQKYLHCSPSRYYLKLRLVRARQLLKQTPMSIIEVASICGFVSTPHFSKCYREYFGIPPRDERLGRSADEPAQALPLVSILPPDAISSGFSSLSFDALSRARGEATFGSVRI
ncbi:AraC family transcriptional regulator [Stutzerimonas kirkiae]|uniref:AraC family transcriptional regulator n=1 Tax=Stutzerimonas kirkiae TaxID=2211392 RepID=A0A4Q9RFB2_9GAMM|nr:GlxA family transcriptional regulator [Stutzerimonas kirkiae]TBU99891.1 AraC family transcriptional regulator [Stutzerimonas kirkiae]TBV05178.1 AraC family transcriptional regulator [Stutzerimonas kirkiae]TBV08081.1 AraC family transcriptional regulator [Stutzerimonas kirkiae]TBV17537.1 AraC family transcriptional regulator [Stutzerimonas kirkiae]